MATKITAADAFAARKADIDALVERIALASEDHFGHGPDDIQWCDVTPLHDAIVLLRRVANSIAPRG